MSQAFSPKPSSTADRWEVKKITYSWGSFNIIEHWKYRKLSSQHVTHHKA